jgi:hypothetical protein
MRPEAQPVNHNDEGIEDGKNRGIVSGSSAADKAEIFAKWVW